MFHLGFPHRQGNVSSPVDRILECFFFSFFWIVVCFFLVSFELFSVSSKVQWTMSDQKDSRTNQKAKVFNEKRSCYENGDEWRGKKEVGKEMGKRKEKNSPWQWRNHFRMSRVGVAWRSFPIERFNFVWRGILTWRGGNEKMQIMVFAKFMGCCCLLFIVYFVLFCFIVLNFCTKRYFMFLYRTNSNNLLKEDL